MKAVRLSPAARNLIQLIQLDHSLMELRMMFIPFSRRAKAKKLAKLIENMVCLQRIDRRAPRHVPFYLFCGIPFLRRFFRPHAASPIDMMLAMQSFEKVPH